MTLEATSGRTMFVLPITALQSMSGLKYHVLASVN